MSENVNKKILPALRPSDACPSLDELIDLTSGQRGEQRRHEAEAHVAGCAHCATELALFREFQEPSVQAEEKADVDAIVARLRENSPVPRAAWWERFLTIRWMAPASLALAAILVGALLWAPGRIGSEAGPRVSGNDDAMRSGRVNVIGPSGALTKAPSKLEWAPLQGATQYRVSLSEVDQTVIWSATVEGSSAVLPAHVAAQVVSLRTFVWQVFALDKSGTVIADSGTQRFRVN